MKIVKKNKTYFINIDDKKEENILEAFLYKSLDLKKEKENLLISIKEKVSKEKIKQKIVSLLNDDSLTFKDKVEGTFEKLLNKEDLKIFNEMLSNNEIETFKLSSKYKKGVYQVFSNKKDSNKPNFSNVSINKKEDKEDIIKTFKSKKYIILKNEEDAKKFSNIFQDKLKDKSIIGIKSFDGNYYVIDKLLFNKIRTKILSLKTSLSFTLDSFKEDAELSKELLKIVIELLKEEGLIFEKRKGSFEFV